MNVVDDKTQIFEKSSENIPVDLSLRFEMNRCYFF